LKAVTPLPETIRVKLSSEEAGAISLTEVVVRDIPALELLEYMLPFTGKDAPRIREILRRGSLVSGASRFRWTGWDADEAGILELLARFPDPDPARGFSAERCVRVIVKGRQRAIEVPREAATRVRRGPSFWDVLMETAASARLRYADYSYRHRADRHEAVLSRADAERLREAVRYLTYTTLRDQILADEMLSIDLFVER
jgi:hypothetical protein